MAERKVAELDRFITGSGRGVATGRDLADVSLKIPTAPDPVDINYPDATALTSIVKDVATWSGRNFVMEPGINTKLQIFAPRKLAPQKAYDLFITSLSVVGLRAVQVGEVIKIVPIQVIVVA